MSLLETVPLLNIAPTACIGLLVGSEICLTAFTNPVLRELDEPAQLKAAHLLTARLAIMPLWNVLGLVLLIVEAVVHRNEPGFSVLVAASALWVAAAAFTFTFMFSLNSRLSFGTRRLAFLTETVTARLQTVVRAPPASSSGAGCGAALPLARSYA
jgi:tryptophan-rich sensory protein